MSVVVDGFAVFSVVVFGLLLVGALCTFRDAQKARRRHIADGLIRRHPAGKGFDGYYAANYPDCPWRAEAGYPQLSDAEIAAFWEANR